MMLKAVKTMEDRIGNAMVVGWMNNGDIKVSIFDTPASEFPWTVWLNITGDSWVRKTVN